MSAFATKESKAILAARAARVANAMGKSVPGLNNYPGYGNLPGEGTDDSLLEQCERIWEATQQAMRDEELTRREDPIIRLWDAEWRLTYLVNNPFSYTFEWVDNDTGTGEIVVAAESEMGQWLIHINERVAAGEGASPCITADYVGARWGGRMTDVSIEETSDGDQIVTATFLHDYENLKWIECFPTPFFPAAIQMRAWILLGPSRWCALTTLFLNLMRDETPLTIPDDPLDLEQWTEGFNVNTWQIVTKPLSFTEDMESGVLWSLPIIRMQYWHDAFSSIIKDAELSVRCDRWLEGDDLPWEGADLRNGALVVSIEDRSGRYNSGTSLGGNLFSGLVNTVDQFSEDFLDTTSSLISNTDVPSEYMQIGYKSTNKILPYVILRPGFTPGVLSAKFVITPEKTAKIITGGKSMPGVNEGISALIQAIGDIIGDNANVGGYGVGSIGGAIDTLLKPFYEDVLLAWTDTKSFQRAQDLGWSRYQEYFQEGADQAYTLNSLMVIRIGLWATRRWYSHEINIMDSCPWMIGDNGVGHMWLGDRVGTTAPRDESGRVWVDRISKLILSADEDNFCPEWVITIGDDAKNRDPFEDALDRIRTLTSGLHDVGVL